MAVELWKKGGPSPNPKGRPKGTFTISTFRKELVMHNKDNIKEVVDVTFVEAKLGKPWAIKLILEYFVGKQVDWGDEDNHALFEDKFKAVGLEQLQTMNRMIFEVFKKQQIEERPTDE